MKAIPATLLFLSTTFSFLQAEKVEEGFTSIFNGKDLTGWECMEGMWMVKDSAITPKVSTVLNWIFWRGAQPADLNYAFLLDITQVTLGCKFSLEPEPFRAVGYQVGGTSK